MPTPVNDVQKLKEYLSGVMNNAEHHGQTVDTICLALFGAILWRKDSEDMVALEREGEMKNVIWVKIGGNKYAFSYNHDTKQIDMRERTTQGRIVHSFSNSTPLSEVKEVFQRL